MLLALNMKPTNQEEKKKINWNIGFKYIVVDHTNIDKAEERFFTENYKL